MHHKATTKNVIPQSQSSLKHLHQTTISYNKHQTSPLRTNSDAKNGGGRKKIWYGLFEEEERDDHVLSFFLIWSIFTFFGQTTNINLHLLYLSLILV